LTTCVGGFFYEKTLMAKPGPPRTRGRYKRHLHDPTAYIPKTTKWRWKRKSAACYASTSLAEPSDHCEGMSMHSMYTPCVSRVVYVYSQNCEA